MTVMSQSREWYADVPRQTRTHTLLGFAGLALGLLGFGVWAGSAQIAGAVVTSGAFVATTQNKIVQHLEGGVIHDILVREGDLVEPGQTLVMLDETAPRAEKRRLELRQARLLAMAARLHAESEERETFAIPHELEQYAGDADIGYIIATERLTFQAHRKSLESDIAAQQDGVNGLQERVNGTTVQRANVQKQLALIEEELAGKELLLTRGFIRKPDVLAVARAKANLEGEIGRLSGEIGDAHERITRALEQIQNSRNTLVKSAVDQMLGTNAELNDVRERLRTANRVLERITITAPVRGIVVKLRYHTEGGVIEPGKNILEIVPLEDELVIEVRVRPQDIDHVKRGQPASIRLTALNRRITPMIEGEVIYLSADAMPDETHGRPATSTSDVYVARIRINAAEAAAAVPSFKPAPGMPAEVYIRTGERTFFEYLMRPVRDSFNRAFRES